MAENSENQTIRGSGDRRDQRSRRRHANARRVSIEVCRSVLRVAIVTVDPRDGATSLKTTSIRWRRQAESLRSEEGRAELTEAFRELVARERIAGCRAAIALGGTLCVNRTAAGPSNKVEQEVAALEERSHLYLSLGPGNKTAAIARRQIDARHTHALITVANEETVRAIAAAAEEVGLTVGVLESSLVSLCRLIGDLAPQEDAVLLAQLDDGQYNLGVCRRGQLLIEYRPTGDSDINDLGDTILQRRDSMSRFCGRQYGIGEVPIGKTYFVGEVEALDQVRRVISKMAFPSVPNMDTVSANWDRIEGAKPGAEMATVIGLALRQQLPEQDSSPNLIEKVLAGARPRVKPFLTRAALPLAATLLVALTLWAFNFQQRLKIDSLRERLGQVQTQASRSQELGLRLRKHELEVRHLSELSQRVPSAQVAPVVAWLGQCMPQDVWLKNVTLDAQGAISVSGASYSEGGVYEFVRHLDAAPWFQDVALVRTVAEQTELGAATGFQLTMTPALPSPQEEADAHQSR